MLHSPRHWLIHWPRPGKSQYKDGTDLQHNFMNKNSKLFGIQELNHHIQPDTLEQTLPTKIIPKAKELLGHIDM